MHRDKHCDADRNHYIRMQIPIRPLYRLRKRKVSVFTEYFIDDDCTIYTIYSTNNSRYNKKYNTTKTNNNNNKYRTTTNNNKYRPKTTDSNKRYHNSSNTFCNHRSSHSYSGRSTNNNTTNNQCIH